MYEYDALLNTKVARFTITRCTSIKSSITKRYYFLGLVHDCRIVSSLRRSTQKLLIRKRERDQLLQPDQWDKSYRRTVSSLISISPHICIDRSTVVSTHI